MDYDNIDEYPFRFKYVQIRSELSDVSKRFIETIFNFTKENNDDEKPNRISKDKILEELNSIKQAINLPDNNKLFKELNDAYNVLEFNVSNNKAYFDLLIKLECALGIYPNIFFHNRSKKIFYDEVYLKVLEGKFNEKDLFDSKKLMVSFCEQTENDTLVEELPEKTYVKTRA